MAVSEPPLAEVTQVLGAFETVGRTAHMPAGLGAEQRRLAGLPGVPLLARTIIPSHWCSQSARWHSFLARRWRRQLNITRGELRSSVLWARITAAVVESRATTSHAVAPRRGFSFCAACPAVPTRQQPPKSWLAEPCLGPPWQIHGTRCIRRLRRLWLREARCRFSVLGKACESHNGVGKLAPERLPKGALSPQ